MPVPLLSGQIRLRRRLLMYHSLLGKQRNAGDSNEILRLRIYRAIKMESTFDLPQYCKKTVTESRAMNCLNVHSCTYHHIGA